MEAVQRRHRQQVQYQRAHLQEEEKRQGNGGKTLRVLRNDVESKQGRDEQDKHQVGSGSRQRNPGVPGARTQERAIDVYGTARQADAAQSHEQHRQQKASHWVRILERVECKVAFFPHGMVSAFVGYERMPKFVETDRKNPADSDDVKTFHVNARSPPHSCACLCEARGACRTEDR